MSKTTIPTVIIQTYLTPKRSCPSFFVSLIPWIWIESAPNPIDQKLQFHESWLKHNEANKRNNYSDTTNNIIQY